MVDGFREIWNLRKTIFHKRKYLETLKIFCCNTFAYVLAAKEVKDRKWV